MSLTNTRPTLIDDVVQWEDVNARDMVPFKNTTGATSSFVIGRTLVLSNGYYVPASGTTADCVLLTAISSLANNGTQEVTVIGLRGDCILNEARMNFDPDGGQTGAFETQQLTDLMGQGCKFVTEPSVTSVG